MKAKRLLVLFTLIVCPIAAVCLVLIISGYVAIFYSGFAIDSSGVLYIGKDTKIEKYADGKLIGTIDPKTSRGYAFTIQNDDTILLSTASIVYTLDLNGNVINEEEDSGTRIFNKLQYGKNRFTTSDGNTYHIKSWFGRTVIISDEGILIYKMSVVDYIVKIVFFSTIFSAFIFIPIIVFKSRKQVGCKIDLLSSNYISSNKRS